jgi:dihydrofolate synthase/folylpolyglutamate synthase
MTAVAIQHFVQEQTDVVILEVGLGGRLDATNVVDTTVSCIVSVDYDHTDVLGEDLTSIATEKAGIIKEGQDVILGVMNDSVDRVFRYIAGTKEATIHQLGQHFNFSVGSEGLSFQSGTFRLEGIKVGLKGNHQYHNAALALEIVHSQQHLRPVTVSSTLRGLAHVEHAGRLEWLTDTILLDAAHNPAGAEKLAEYLQEIRDTHKLPVTLLLGCSQEKNLRSISVILGGAVDRIFATHCSHPRAKSATDIVREVKVDTPIFDMGDVESAIQHCRWGEELVVVAGSIFLVGAVKDIWEQRSSIASSSIIDSEVDDNRSQ